MRKLEDIGSFVQYLVQGRAAGRCTAKKREPHRKNKAHSVKDKERYQVAKIHSEKRAKYQTTQRTNFRSSPAQLRDFYTLLSSTWCALGTSLSLFSCSSNSQFDVLFIPHAVRGENTPLFLAGGTLAKGVSPSDRSQNLPRCIFTRVPKIIPRLCVPT